jgi:hypothetical protein
MIGFVPRPVHAVLDYTWGALFTAAPEIWGFSDNDVAATLYSRFRGLSAIGASLFTRYELGLVRVIPFNVHLVIDLVSALSGFVSPQIFGFSKNKRTTQVVYGFCLFEVVAVLLSKRDK